MYNKISRLLKDAKQLRRTTTYPSRIKLPLLPLTAIIAFAPLVLDGCSAALLPTNPTSAKLPAAFSTGSTSDAAPTLPRPTGSPLQPGSPQTGELAPLTPPVIVPGPPHSVTNFGDSITCGYFATPSDGTGRVVSMEGYAGLLDAQIGVPSQNLCRPGDLAADMTRQWVYPNARPALGQSQLYTIMIGVNDASACGPATGCIQDWSQEVAASLAWLALPPGDKVLATAMTPAGGTWTPDLDFGEATTTQGASLNFTVPQTVAGRSLMLAYRVFAPWAANTGTASLTVDGAPVATMSSFPNTGLWIYTPNGTQDTIFLVTVPLGAVGLHNVSVQLTSATGTFFSVLWAGASTGNYAYVAGAPRVILGSIAISNNPAVNPAISLYNQALTPMVQELVANGLNITVAPTATALTIPTDFSDEVHPNNGGHAKLAAAFEGVL